MNEDKSARVVNYLHHALQALDRISRYVQNGETDFLRDEKTQDAVIRNIEILGEAARNVERVDPALVTAHAEIPWSVIYGMRNHLSHGYFEVDLAIVWQTVQQDLPRLEAQFRALLRVLQQHGEPFEAC